MIYKNIMAMFGMFFIAMVGLAFAEKCPTLPIESSLVDNIVRYEEGTGFIPSTITATVEIEQQYGPDNCLFSGYVIVVEATDPFFQLLGGEELGLVGSMSVDGKKVFIDRSLGSYHTRGVLTNYDRRSKTYKGSEYFIDNNNISGKGKTSAIE